MLKAVLLAQESGKCCLLEIKWSLNFFNMKFGNFDNEKKADLFL